MPKRSIAQILADTSEFLFPAECGEAPVTLESRAPDGDTALHVLAWQNDIEGIQSLVEAGADVNAIGDMGSTPLHVAVAQGNAVVAALLLAAGARPDVASEICGTAREEALRKGRRMAGLFPQSDA